MTVYISFINMHNVTTVRASVIYLKVAALTTNAIIFWLQQWSMQSIVSCCKLQQFSMQ